ncbi:MAG: DUF3034 family protein [Pseudomonadota bacterium]
MHRALVVLLSAAIYADPAGAQTTLGDGGRLLATGGVSQIEGAGGGGVAVWALITGYGSRDSYGVNAHYTHVALPDFEVRSAGAAAGVFDRVEVSYAHTWFDTNEAGASLGLGEDFTFEQDVIGVKVRLFGDAVYDQHTWVPQVSAGVQYKSTSEGDILRVIGAEDDADFDYYIAASKLFLRQNLLVNGAVRFTRGNQFGILGYGGDEEDGHTPQFEGGLAYLLRRDLVVGGDYRTRPDNLGFAEENDAYDIFVAWFPSKRLSLTAAYADLGDVALQGDQGGAYISLQAGF